VKKIIFVSQSLRRGGAERIVSLLSQEFNRIGFDVKIVLFANEIEYDYSGEIINMETPASKSYIVKIFRLFQRTYKLKQIFKKERPDYIFSFMESSNFASILTGKKVVVSIHNNPNIKLKSYQKYLIQKLYNFKNVKKVITVSKGIEKILNNEYYINNTQVIYNPVNFNNVKDSKKSFNYSNYILSVGRLQYQKNFELLINAYSKTKVSKYVKLLIVGGGDERNKLLQLIKTLNLEDKVILTGQVNNVEDYYKNALFYVLSSRFEGFGNVIAEALYFDLPVISTNCPFGPNEIIKHMDNGILIENENEKQLIEMIDELYFDYDLQGKLKNNGKKSIQHLNVDKIAKKWIDVI